MTFALVIHPLTIKNRPCALIWACALNLKNTVDVLEYKDIEKRLRSHNIYRIEYENIENWLESTKVDRCA